MVTAGEPLPLDLSASIMASFAQTSRGFAIGSS